MDSPDEPTPHLPEGFYEGQAPAMMFAVLGCLVFFDQGDDHPLVREVTELTGLTYDFVSQLQQVRSTADLEPLYFQHPDLYYYAFVVSRQTMSSPLLRQTIRDVLRNGPNGLTEQQADDEIDNATTYFDRVLPVVAQGLQGAGFEAELTTLQVEGAFARHAEHPHLTAAQAETTSGPGAQVWFNELQQQLLRIVFIVPTAVRLRAEPPLNELLGAMDALSEDRLQHLSDKLAGGPPDTPVHVSLPQLLTLYQALQISALISVATGPAADLMPQLTVTPTSDDPDDAEAQQMAREGICILAEGISQRMTETFPEEPSLQAAQAEIAALVPLLQ